MKLPCFDARAAPGTRRPRSCRDAPGVDPPIIGSTMVSTTLRPSLRATSGPMARSPRGPRLSAAARSRRAGRARCHRSRGSPIARAARTLWDAQGEAVGSGRRRPRAHTAAPMRRWPQRLVEPDLPAQCDRLGATSQEAVGPESSRRPSNDSLRNFPPRRSRLEHDHCGRPGPGPRRRAQFPRRRQPGDAPPITATVARCAEPARSVAHEVAPARRSPPPPWRGCRGTRGRR